MLREGEQFGKWTVDRFDRVDERRRVRYWCRCVCGVEETLHAAAVKAGRTRSCKRCRAAFLEGRRFGKWTVTARAENKGMPAKTAWRCKCDCGHEAVVVGNNLVRGISKACFDCGHKKLLVGTRLPASWLAKQISQAAMRGLAWEVEEPYLMNLWDRQGGICALSGRRIILANRAREMTASLDRIDSSGPYRANNVQWVHKHFNMMKQRYSQDYFVEMCCDVADYHRLPSKESA